MLQIFGVLDKYHYLYFEITVEDSNSLVMVGRNWTNITESSLRLNLVFFDGLQTLNKPCRANQTRLSVGS